MDNSGAVSFCGAAGVCVGVGTGKEGGDNKAVAGWFEVEISACRVASGAPALLMLAIRCIVASSRLMETVAAVAVCLEGGGGGGGGGCEDELGGGGGGGGGADEDAVGVA